MSGLPGNLYARARLLGTPGIEATIKLNPTEWSTRMRNAVIKSLRTGVVTGGWGSKTRKISELVLKSRQLRYIQTEGWHTYVHEPLPLSPEAEFQALQILQTDFTVARLKDAGEYRLRNRREQIESLEKDAIGPRSNRHFWLDEPYCTEFASLLAAHLPEWETKERNKLADDILAGRTITIQE